MPELPEVERGRRVMHGACVGKTVARVDVLEDDIVFVDKAHALFKSHLEGKLVMGSGRRGKLFYLEIADSAHHVVLHFGMTGSVRVKGQDGLKYIDFDTSGDEWPPRFWKFVMVMSDGTEIAFTDPRRLAKVRLVSGHPLDCAPIKDLAPDPVHNMPSLSDFQTAVQRRNKSIKALLLDQNDVVSGIGNWIADEVLYQAQIHPSQNTSQLTEAALEKLYNSISNVIKLACDVNADSEQFPTTWLFHYRWFKGKTRSTLSEPADEDDNGKQEKQNDDQEKQSIKAAKVSSEPEIPSMLKKRSRSNLTESTSDTLVRSPSTLKRRMTSRSSSLAEEEDIDDSQNNNEETASIASPSKSTSKATDVKGQPMKSRAKKGPLKTVPTMPDGNKIVFVTVGGRTTAVVPAVQEVQNK